MRGLPESAPPSPHLRGFSGSVLPGFLAQLSAVDNLASLLLQPILALGPLVLLCVGKAGNARPSAAPPQAMGTPGPLACSQKGHRVKFANRSMMSSPPPPALTRDVPVEGAGKIVPKLGWGQSPGVYRSVTRRNRVFFP